jgi:hypothetical protein
MILDKGHLTGQSKLTLKRHLSEYCVDKHFMRNSLSTKLVI